MATTVLYSLSRFPFRVSILPDAFSIPSLSFGHIYLTSFVSSFRSIWFFFISIPCPVVPVRHFSTCSDGDDVGHYNKSVACSGGGKGDILELKVKSKVRCQAW